MAETQSDSCYDFEIDFLIDQFLVFFLLSQISTQGYLLTKALWKFFHKLERYLFKI